MISLPLLHSLDVTGYGLYPGDEASTPGLHAHFAPGLTLVLGANGLGKTTLVTMLYRLLTGPFDIPILLRGADLGTASLQETPLSGSIRRTFAGRVADGAAQATARLVFDVGGEEVTVERNLRDLTLKSFSVGTSPSSSDEILYQEEIVRLANIPTFGDWILLLRYIVFYFEDRRSLLWDPSAQRQLLRILFLEPDLARNWTKSEREILEADSEVRNLRAVTTRQERILVNDESRAANESEIREELRELEQHLRNVNESLDEVNFKLPDTEDRHEKARQRFLTLEQERESKYRELERAQLLAVNSRLPQHSDSARYILAQLLTEADCLVCGNNVPSVMELMESRISGNECIVCGSYLVTAIDRNPVDLSDDRVSFPEGNLHAIETELDAARSSFEEAESERNRIISEIRGLQAEIAERTARVEMLLQRLPPEEGQLHERRREIASWRGRVEVLQVELDEKRMSFEQTITAANAVVEEQASKVQNSFFEYANEFLFEDCRLVWSPKSASLGQTGRRFDFPAFELELGGSNFSGTVRRSGPDDVSESQREFIDISFRIALARVATSRHVTTLVMDAPESSLDAVFVRSAGRVLGTFSRREKENRLVVTSNLVDGDLIPYLLRVAADEGDRTPRVVDLLTIAAPTAAVRSHRSAYNSARDWLLERAMLLMRAVCWRHLDVYALGALGRKPKGLIVEEFADSVDYDGLRRRVRLLMLLDGAERAGIAPIRLRHLHTYAYLSNVLAPVWNTRVFDGRLLKRRGGPFYPSLQHDLDRLVGLGLVIITNLGHIIDEDNQCRLEGLSR